MSPVSLNDTGKALLLGDIEVVPNTSVYPSIEVPPPPEPAWVTLTVTGPTPDPVIVKVAERESTPMFSVAVRVMVLLFDPLLGETLSQLGISLILQVVLELILNVPLDPEEEPIEILVGEAFKYVVVPPDV